MKRELTTRAVVLGSYPAGEHSVRVQLFTEDYGLMSVLGRSARTERSKLRGFLVTGSYGTYTLVPGKAQTYVTGAVGVKNLFYEEGGNERLTFFARLAHAVTDLVRGDGGHELIFQTLFSIAKTRSLQAELFETQFHIALARVLMDLGYYERDERLSSDDWLSRDVVSSIDPAEVRTRVRAGLTASGLASGL